MRIPRLLAGIAAAAILPLLAACGPKDAPAGGPAPAGGGGDVPVLRVGLEPKYPPFESTDEKNEVIGFDVDLARALAEKLGRRATFVPMDFDALLPALQSGRIDCICSAMSHTPERAQQVDFTRPYVRTAMGVLVSTRKGARIEQFEDLDDPEHVIAVQRGTSGETKARERFPKAKIVPYDTEVDAGNEVASNRATAFVYDMVSVRKIAEKSGTSVRVLEGNLGTEDYCVVFPKGSPLTAEANRFLDGASAPGGVIAGLMAKWKPSVELVPPGTK